jgi:hypothetical protein
MVNMTMRWKSVVLVASLACAAACSKSKVDAARCNEVAGGAVDRMVGAVANNPGMPEDAKAQMKEKGDKLKAVIAKRCVEDNWASEVLDCYAKAGSMPEIRTCRGKLPPEQSQKLQTEELQAMMGGAPRVSPDELQKRLDDLGKQSEAAQQALSNATDDAARAAAKEKVVQLQRQQLLLRAQMQAAKGAPGGGPGMGGPGMGGGPGGAPPAPMPPAPPAPAGSGSAAAPK